MAPSAEAQDPGVILEDWIHRTSNLHEEIRFLQSEIQDKDRVYMECVKSIEESDVKVQRWIRANGSHQHNPREELLRSNIRENYAKADRLANEKLALSEKLQFLLEKHLRHMDGQIKVLYDRGEPGFTDPDELPSVLRPSAANHSIPSTKFPTTAASHPLNPILNHAAPSGARISNPQVRSTQSLMHNSASAPATPATSMIMNRKERESSAGPGSGVPKRGPRNNGSMGNVPPASSGLARHSSMGPGTPKAGTPGSTARAGSVGPRGTVKSAGVRKSTPSGATGRKKPPSAKSGLNRVKQAGRSKGSPTSTPDSELSDAESAPSSRAASRAGSGTPAPASANTTHLPHKRPPKHRELNSDDDIVDRDSNDDASSDIDEDDEEGKKYCLCQHVSYGDMVACDNPNCPYEWFHWNCVGLKSEPQGRWFCPECTESLRKKGK
ncbi:uncharacterized protein BCR38DRAFT_233790 [Pseudomassariella vexata]|uniref:Chromatin modification-related protein n=1 Tax=Pseudomassariella vexata TaxID=1141098 RepID=A0A1Y2DSC2_9PEZI|nr:uncharacterized protein BCR38DRAFT_233790 [Pseudomassariella vexata]ORY62160.1 hypothetical protein BCR38DRAFT_233790 [Pseudomassariella vexata]